MNRSYVSIGTLLAALAVCSLPARVDARASDEADIKALEERFAAAFKAKDLKAIMACYVPDQSLVVFDVVPPRQYVGAPAYQKDFEEFFSMFPGPVEFEMSDLSVTVDGKIGYGHSIQRTVLTDKDGKKYELTVRVTDGYRKINGKWLIAHEHVSVPVDLMTGKADLASKP